MKIIINKKVKEAHMKKLIHILLIASVIYSCKSKTNNSPIEKSNSVEKVKKTLVVENKEDECTPKGSYLWSFLSIYAMREKSDDYFIFLTKKELRLMRNSIFAGKGYRFKSSDLKSFFMSQSWYCPKYDNVDSLLSEIERDNITYLLELENKAKDNYNKKEIRDYFISLFKYKATYLRTAIPYYYQINYLHSESGYVDYPQEILSNSNDYLAFIINNWGGDDSDGVYTLITLDNNNNLISEQRLGSNYKVLTRNKVKCIEINCSEDYSECDTISQNIYVIDSFGKIIKK